MSVKLGERHAYMQIITILKYYFNKLLDLPLSLPTNYKVKYII